MPGGLAWPGRRRRRGRRPAGPTATPAQITADSRFVIVSTQADAGRSRARRPRTRRRGGEPPVARDREPCRRQGHDDRRRALVPPGARQRNVARLRARARLRDAGDSSARGGAGSAAGGGGRGRGGRGGGGAAGGRRQFGSPLVLRNLATGAEERLTDVLDVRVRRQREGPRATRSSRAIRRRTARSSATWRAARRRRCSRAAATTRRSTFDRTGTQLLFVSDRDEFGRATTPRYTLYQASAKGGAAQAIVTPSQVPTGTAHRRQRAARVHALAARRSRSTSRRRRSTRCRPIRSSARRCSTSGTTRIRCFSRRSASTRARDRNKSLLRRSTIPATKKLVQLADDSIPTRERVGRRQDRRRELARALHDRADVGRRRHRRLRRSIRRRTRAS